MPYTAPQQPHARPQASTPPYAQPQAPYGQAGSSHTDPRSAYTGSQPSYAQPQSAQSAQSAYTEPPRPYEEQRTAYGESGSRPGYQEARPQEARPPYEGVPQAPYEAAYAPAGAAADPRPEPQPYAPPYGASSAADETLALSVTDFAPSAGSPTPSVPSAGPAAPSSGQGAPGGRAARRKASRHRGRRGGPGVDGAQDEPVDSDASEAPTSRVAARRAARARKPGAAVMASRAIGEVFITTGVLMLLFVTYQLYWTNIRAHAQADSAASSLQNDWASGKGAPGTFEPGQGFALLHIPKLDVVVPIAEGTDKKRVLDRGMVGHYAEEGVKTAMPDAKKGNFGLAGHRNTHGEPFRYINRLKPGDPIVVETQDKYFVYKMASILPVTSPSNTSVLDAVPKGSTFKSAGRYITLTTCTPEFTSKYRMIVWGTMVEERSRDKGKPDALVG
ncbi:class E sortase [Streptomyces sp. NPDC048484]|uniref:class E sortase n=1 Tax=Streptomyces sp. NPDC048484 TaxID=3155146 RepID=UPI00342A8D80